MSSGSEHTKSVTSFPMEAQLIHFKDSFNDLESASSSNKWDSIAIVAVFYNVRQYIKGRRLEIGDEVI